MVMRSLVNWKMACPLFSVVRGGDGGTPLRGALNNIIEVRNQPGLTSLGGLNHASFFDEQF